MTSPSVCHWTFTLFPLRYAIAAMGILAILSQYILKVTLSVAIGGMVKQVAQETSADETCPLPDTASINSTDSEGGQFEWDEDMQGYILSSYYYGYAAVNIIAGYLAARYSARWVFVTGLLAAGVFTVVGPICADAGPVVFMITRLLVGTFSGVIIPAMHVLLGKWFPENERQRLGGPIFSAAYLGTVVSMALSGTIVKNLGWYSVFYIFGGIAIALVIPCLYFIYDEPESHPRITEKEKDFLLTHTGRDLTESKEKKELEKEDELIRNPWPLILTCPAMWAHNIISIGGAWVNYTLLTELPTYMENILHYDIDEAGLISALPYLFGWMSCSIYSFLTEKLTQRGIHIMTIFRIWDAVSCIGPAICFLALTFINCDIPAIITLFVFTMVFRCAIYGGSYLNHIYLFPRAYGSAAGLNLTLGNCSGIVTPIVTSAFVSGRQTIQQWKYVFYVAMTLSVIPYFVFLILGSVDDQEIKWEERREKKRKQKLGQ
ncbi:sialin-like isoform X1 [Schistocerca gregaria]|uniref:sialin-like isoform X1 n=2 Tax=Schistocerca gregaria TaxID=7010 RepID=UPI00211E18B7|nr:sialin-like isoform X1 [Schistocerca gregaria]